jgi:uncharacterized membrane protein
MNFFLQFTKFDGSRRALFVSRHYFLCCSWVTISSVCCLCFTRTGFPWIEFRRCVGESFWMPIGWKWLLIKSIYIFKNVFKLTILF